MYSHGLILLLAGLRSYPSLAETKYFAAANSTVLLSIRLLNTQPGVYR